MIARFWMGMKGRGLRQQSTRLRGGICLILILCATLGVFAQSVTNRRIVTAARARLRSAPETSSNEVSRLSLGTSLSELSKSEDGKWYRVTTPDSKTGWVFASLTEPYNEAERITIYRRIALSKLALEESPLNDRIELFEFLSRVRRDAEGAERAELELLRLRALHHSVKPIGRYDPSDPLHRSWLKQHEGSLAYSEPAGQWLVRADLYWDLAEKFRSQPNADEIAWEAASTSLPGECEGFLECYMAGLRLTVGRYLDRFPRGNHVGEALDQINDLLGQALKPDNFLEVEPSERGNLHTSITELIKTLQRVSNPRTAQTILWLQQVDKRYVGEAVVTYNCAESFIDDVYVYDHDATACSCFR